MSAAEGTGSKASVEVTLCNTNGLHARPAHLFVQTANGFASTLQVQREGMGPIDGKSIMGVMMLVELIENGFGED